MKKYLTILLLMLVSMAVVAKTSITDLTIGEEGVINDTWKYCEVTDAKDHLHEYDILLVSFDAAISGNQYAICSATEKTEDNKNFKKLVSNGNQDWFDCSEGQTEFTVNITADILKEIQRGGLRIEYNGLKNLKVSCKHFPDDLKKFIPEGATSIGSGLPMPIKDWYASPYLLQDDNFDAVGKTLRVICSETGDDAYAFLKINDAQWSSIMSGTDKFSIAGWKYFDVKVNKQLNEIIQKSWQDGDSTMGGLLIGGNNFTISGIYLYGNKMDDVDNTLAWNEDPSDVIDTYTFTDAIGGTDWSSANIPGSFFEFQSATGNQVAGNGVTSTTKLANTKNHIIRLVFEGKAADDAQVSAKDTENDNCAAYIRQRQSDLHYTNYANCPGADHYDFELSDAITKFQDYETPIIGTEGVQTGMLSKLLLNGMNIGAKGAKIKSVQIRKSQVSKYIKGYAELSGHTLSNTAWRAIAFPYNLTRAQLQAAFGEDVRICELGSSKVLKTKITSGKNVGSYHFSILFNFEKIKDSEGVNANYPYLIKLGSGVKDDDVYPIENVVADVRDFQAYEFRTGKFNLDALDEKDKPAEEKQDKVVTAEEEIRNALNNDNVCMKFKSTAPIFNIHNESNTQVEIIDGVKNDGFTPLLKKDENGGNTNYYLKSNTLFPVEDYSVRLASGRAYVILPAETKALFDANNQVDPYSESKPVIAYSFDYEGGETTGIEELENIAPAVRQAQMNVYTLNGQVVRKGQSTVGLPKGIYIVGGKKLIIK